MSQVTTTREIGVREWKNTEKWVRMWKSKGRGQLCLKFVFLSTRLLFNSWLFFRIKLLQKVILNSILFIIMILWHLFVIKIYKLHLIFCFVVFYYFILFLFQVSLRNYWQLRKKDFMKCSRRHMVYCTNKMPMYSLTCSKNLKIITPRER